MTHDHSGRVCVYTTMVSSFEVVLAVSLGTYLFAFTGMLNRWLRYAVKETVAHVRVLSTANDCLITCSNLGAAFASQLFRCDWMADSGSGLHALHVQCLTVMLYNWVLVSFVQGCMLGSRCLNSIFAS